MSRKSPACFSSSINGDRLREDRGASDGVAASLDGVAAHQVHPATEPVLKVFLDRAHFKKSRVASWQEFNQQIHIAASPARAARHDAEPGVRDGGLRAHRRAGRGAPSRGAAGEGAPQRLKKSRTHAPSTVRSTVSRASEKVSAARAPFDAV